MIVALIVLVAPPLVMLALELTAGALRRGAAARLHVLFVALLVALLGAYALRELGLPGAAAAPLGLGLGAGAALAYSRLEGARSLALALAPAPLLFGLWFVLVSPASALVLSPDGDYVLERKRAEAPIVLVLLDELPTVSLLDADGRLDTRRYPGFAELAGTSTWYRDATTVHAETRWAVPAIFTGRRSPEESIAVTADHERSLFTLLGGEQSLNVSEPYTRVCPQDLCPREDQSSRWGRVREVLRSLSILAGQRVLPGSLAARLPELVQFEQVDPERQLRGFLAAVSRGGPPAVNVLHLLQPHGPWNRGVSGEPYESDLPANLELTDFDVIPDDRWWALQLRQRHLAQLQYTDRLLRRLIDGLRRRRVWQRAVVVVVADHGVSTLPGVRLRDPTPTNAHDILPVPLFVKASGQRAARVSRAPARTTDVLPTIAALAGVRLPYEVEGEDLRDLSPADRPTATSDGVRVPDVRVRVADLRSRMLRAARTNAAVFGDGDPRAIMRAGPRPELVGRRVRVGRLPRAAGMSVELDGGAGTIRISGRLTGVPAGEAVPLAVVVDGRVAATTLTYRHGPAGAFTALLPKVGRASFVLIDEGGLRMLPRA